MNTMELAIHFIVITGITEELAAMVPL